LDELFQKDHKQERAKQTDHERQLEELYAEIGRLTTQVNWLKKKSGLDLFEK
jgi:5'-3' exonuclease